VSGAPAYVTRSPTGDVRALLWNYVDPDSGDFSGADYLLPDAPCSQTLVLRGATGRYRVRVLLVDRSHGNSYRAWQRLGEPRYPSRAQLAALAQEAEPVEIRDEILSASGGELRLTQTLAAAGMCFIACERVG